MTKDGEEQNVQIISRNIRGIHSNLAAASRHRALVVALQETDIAEAHVFDLQDQAISAGYTLAFGRPCSMGQDANSTWGRRVGIMVRSPTEPVITQANGDPASSSYWRRAGGLKLWCLLVTGRSSL